MRTRWSLRVVVLAVVLGGLGSVIPAASAAVPVAPGLSYRAFSIRTPRGYVHGHLLRVDLRRRSLRLLWEGAVTRRGTVAALAARRGALAAVNGDFFDVSEHEHPGVPMTGAPVGPMIVGRQAIKGAVPEGQRFGWSVPHGDTDRDVFGIGRDGRPHLDRLDLRGTARTPYGVYRLRGLNQYALPVGGIGAFTWRWGAASRERAVCGTDHSRRAGCAEDTWEVAVRHGVVVRTSEDPGAGAIPAGETVLLGRESGADRLRMLQVGDHVKLRYRLVSRWGTHFRWAMGAYRLDRYGRPVPGVDAGAAAPRTAIGFSRSGRYVWLLAVDGRGTRARGLTGRELAREMARLHAWSAVYLDGGGSTSMTLRHRVVSPPWSGGRRVPNAIGVF